jgi:hypothetical protein
VSAAQSSRISRLAGVPLAVLLVGTLAVSGTARKASAHEKVLNGHARPLATFVPNAGQFRNRELRYTAQGAGYAFAFTRHQVGLSLSRQNRVAALSLRFVHANPGVKLEARTKLPGKVNYLIGRDPTKWRTGLPTYRELVYRSLWTGIDLHVRGEPGRLKYEFHLRPGADPSRIRLAYRGARGLSLTPTAALAISTPFGVLTDARPLSYQRVGGRSIPIATAYSLRPRSGYGFALGRHDSSRPLVIDPGIEYSTYVGGSGSEGASGIAVEGGYAYISGCTVSDDFPTTPGAFQPTHNQGGDYPLDEIVTKLS